MRDLSGVYHLETGIGRAVERSWADELQAIFNSHAPNDVTLQMRSTPGVVYVPAQTLEGLSNTLCHGDEETEQRAESGLRLLIDGLYRRRLIGETALMPAPVNLRKRFAQDIYTDIVLKNGRVQALFYASVEDRREQTGLNFLLQSEKQVLRQVLGIEVQSSPNSAKTPKHEVNLGLLEANADTDWDFLGSIRSELSDQLTLSAMGPIRSR